MGLIRNALLAASQSRSLRDRAMRLAFVKRSVARFMPGERLDDALAAADSLGHIGIKALLTQLGENVTDPADADAVARHYMEVLAASAARRLDCQISVKPTQLGLDVDEARCYASLRTLAGQAAVHGSFVWMDMEQHAYVDRTLALYRRMVAEFPNVGVCLQAYLYRTADDLASIRPDVTLGALGGGVRLVKGAYREPASVAYPRKRDVDDNFVTLATQMLAAPSPAAARCRAVFGTHDSRMIEAVQAHAEDIGARRDSFEFHLLYGIKPAMQKRLAQEGHLVRVLISYGTQWFPWYMRRLAERPANVLFVAKSMFAR